MQSILVISKDSQRREEKALALCHEAGIDTFDISIVERGEQAGKPDETKLKQSLGIEDIKILQKTLYLKPLRGEKKAIVIHDAHLLTTEAQNALLKTLEEPPESTILILTAETDEALLPTVLSRCQIITLEHTELKITPAERAELTELLAAIGQWGVGDALKAAERLAKNKEDTLVYLEKMILILREKILDSYDHTESSEIRDAVSLLKRLQETHKIIKTTNANLRLTLEIFFLS